MLIPRASGHDGPHQRCQQPMIGPQDVLVRLAVDEAELLHLVNSGRLSAYALGDGLRFAPSEVEAVGATLSHEASISSGMRR